MMKLLLKNTYEFHDANFNPHTPDPTALAVITWWFTSRSGTRVRNNPSKLVTFLYFISSAEHWEPSQLYQDCQYMKQTFCLCQ